MLPATHAVHADAPAAEYVPAAQVAHVRRPAVPAAQVKGLEQTAAPTRLSLPVAQLVQADDPVTAANELAGHATQADEPVAAANWPVRQLEQAAKYMLPEVLATAEYMPTGQVAQPDDPVLAWKVPPEHATHAVAPVLAA